MSDKVLKWSNKHSQFSSVLRIASDENLAQD